MGTILSAIYALMEKYYIKVIVVMDCEVVKRYVVVVNVVFGVVVVYSEWVLLVLIMWSGLIEACGMFLVRLVFFARAFFFFLFNI